jgi:predicted transcriptional regulator
MKKHTGMRPHDIIILLKIVSKSQEEWYMKDLAYELGISASEVSESLNRSVIAGLISSDKKSIHKLSLLDFLKSGLRYVYPQRPGAMSRGMGTAHSAAPLKNKIRSEEHYVWPYAQGKMRGQSIKPLHPKLPEACLKDAKLYELMALTDAIRVGKARERNLAIEMITEKIQNA